MGLLQRLSVHRYGILTGLSDILLHTVYIHIYMYIKFTDDLSVCRISLLKRQTKHYRLT